MKSCKRISKHAGLEIDRAVKVLRQGGVISFPTETYYGLGADPFNRAAVEKLFRLKKRARRKPILVLVQDIAMLSLLVSEIPSQYLPLMEKFWPGPLTLVFPVKKEINRILTGGGETIGVRISSNQVVEKLMRKWQAPLTATSSNISGGAPAVDAGQVYENFNEQLDYVLDGGSTPAGLCSTIISLENGKAKEIRKGQIAMAEIEAAINAQ